MASLDSLSSRGPREVHSGMTARVLQDYQRYEVRKSFNTFVTKPTSKHSRTPNRNEYSSAI